MGFISRKQKKNHRGAVDSTGLSSGLGNDIGIYPVYKPKGPSSYDIIRDLKKITGIKKIGHAGTLDPLAEGVLVVAIGKDNTKRLPKYAKNEKEYYAIIELGKESSTDDAEGIKKDMITGNPPDAERVREIISKFKGKIIQRPPNFSAIKIKGDRAYKLAREGKNFEIKPREVEIKEIEMLEYDYPKLVVRSVTGPGAYIRSLARDIGRALKTGGYLKELKRTRVGKFSAEKSFTLEQFKNHL